MSARSQVLAGHCPGLASDLLPRGWPAQEGRVWLKGRVALGLAPLHSVLDLVTFPQTVRTLANLTAQACLCPAEAPVQGSLSNHPGHSPGCRWWLCEPHALLLWLLGEDVTHAGPQCPVLTAGKGTRRRRRPPRTRPRGRDVLPQLPVLRTQTSNVGRWVASHWTQRDSRATR